MRLREIQKKLLNIVDILVVGSTQRLGPTPPQFQLSNILVANQGIRVLEEIGLFEKEIEGLKTTDFYDSPNDVIIVNQQDNGKIIGLISEVKSAVVILLKALDQALGSSELPGDSTVSIKFDKLKGFDDLELVITQLKKAIQIPLSEYKEGGEIKIINFDSGSFWIDIMVPASSCVALIGSIAWAGAVIYKKWLEVYAFKQYVKGLEIQAEHLQVLADAAKKKIDLDIEAEARLIQNEFLTPGDNEQLNKLKMSIKESSKLIQKGVEIKPALTAPEKITNLFPKYKPLELLESKIKKIEN